MALHALHGQIVGDGGAGNFSRAQIKLLYRAVCQGGVYPGVQDRGIKDRRVEGDLLDLLRRVDQRQRSVERRRDKLIGRVPQRRPSSAESSVNLAAATAVPAGNRSFHACPTRHRAWLYSSPSVVSRVPLGASNGCWTFQGLTAEKVQPGQAQQ
ncbi:hypothetical protein KL909_004331 [Ogataea angusta]|nr:hypothetical protein KL909_004331 [Ogataea angusta]